jgi:hypothetical protein
MAEGRGRIYLSYYFVTLSLPSLVVFSSSPIQFGQMGRIDRLT